jgi:ClpP class serine protease
VDIKILLEAIGRPWFIEPSAASYYASIVEKLFTGESITEFKDQEVKEFAFMVNAAGKRMSTVADAQDNGVAVINMKGAMMKYDYCGAPGTQSICKAIQQACDNQSCSAIILRIDSPGGAVDGTQQLADCIKQCCETKPIVAFIDGCCCSAVMWAASACDQRIASSNTDTVGSVGTMATFTDRTGYMDKMGIKQRDIYATDSTHKNLPHREALKGNDAPMISTWLDPLNNEFQSAVKANLPGVDPTALNGSHYIAKDAKKKGLVDKIGTFESAVKAALQLAKDKQKNNSSKNNNNKMAFEKTMIAAKATQFAVVDGGFLLSEENLNNTEAALIAAETAATTATADLATATAAATKAEGELATANATIAAQKTQVDNLSAEVERLKKSAPPATQTVVDQDKPVVDPSVKQSFLDSKSNSMNAFADGIMGNMPAKTPEKK